MTFMIFKTHFIKSIRIPNFHLTPMLLDNEYLIKKIIENILIYDINKDFYRYKKTNFNSVF